MKRQASQTVTRRNQDILEKIHQIKANHPFWGLPEGVGLFEICG